MIDAKDGGMGGGTVNDAYFGGGNASVNTEQWNGTNWSEAHSMPTSTANQHMGGNTPSELYFIMTNPFMVMDFLIIIFYRWYCIKLYSQNMILGETRFSITSRRYVCWNCISWLGWFESIN